MQVGFGCIIVAVFAASFFILASCFMRLAMIASTRKWKISSEAREDDMLMFVVLIIGRGAKDSGGLCCFRKKKYCETYFYRNRITNNERITMASSNDALLHVFIGRTCPVDSTQIWYMNCYAYVRNLTSKSLDLQQIHDTRLVSMYACNAYVRQVQIQVS